MRSSRRSSWRCRLPSISVLLWLLVAAAAWADEGGVLSGSIDDDTAESGKGRPDGGGSASGPAASASAVRFDAALRLLTTGQERRAALELVKLAHERPEDDVAPEALFEAALLYEETLSEPETARRYYRELCERYPHSRLLRRAQKRLEALAAALSTGAAPLVLFQAILRSTGESSRERQSRLAALLAEHPDFALADQALFLLADTALRLGEGDAARRYLDELYRRYPQSQWAGQGHKLHAETLLASRRIAEARSHYQALLRFPGPLWPLLAQEGLVACSQASRRLYLAITAWGLLGLLALCALYYGRKGLWPPPFEIYYYVPVAGFLSGAALLVQGGAGGAVVAPIWQFGLAGAVLSWLAAAAARRPRSRLFWGLFVRAAGVVALSYLIVYHHGLIDVLIETVRNGPEAD